MVFDNFYHDWNHRRVKKIINHYGHQAFFDKTVLDLGCGHSDIGGALARLGARVIAVDAREEHLQVAKKKYPHITTTKVNLDAKWPFDKQRFDFVICAAIVCHLTQYKNFLQRVCSIANNLILESEVCDSDDPNRIVRIDEHHSIYDWAFNGVAYKPSAAHLEHILTVCGMEFKRLDSPDLNTGPYKYDWIVGHTETRRLDCRRFWICKNSNIHESPDADFFLEQKITNTLTTPSGPTDNAISITNSTTLSPVSAVVSLPPEIGDKKFVIVIPSYKNSSWCIQNIQSCLNQNYNKYRIIFTDDCSNDDTFDQVKAVVDRSAKANKCTLIRNTTRIGALANLYNMIHSCYDDEIILTLDGDDWFPHENVLNILNGVYSNSDVWMTYGQYKNHPDGGFGVAHAYAQYVIDSNGFREANWAASHLRTFYTWLFKKIRKEDLMYKGNFYSMTWDLCMMFPMLEMAGNHSRFLSDILYVYNLSNPINDHKVNQQLQQTLDRHIRSLPKYQRTEKPIIRNINVGLLIIATNKYTRFVQGLISSADKYFLNAQNCDVSYYIFTDHLNTANSHRKIVEIPIEHKPFPYASMDRFKHFTNHADKFANEDYLFYIDVDSMFVDSVSGEILGNLVGVRHCGYYNKTGTYENNPNSCLYVPENYHKKYKYYFGGGFSGGRRDNYLELSKWCMEKIDQDVARGIVPIWHDESALNRYFLEVEPDVVLTPAYHYPESNIEHYKAGWLPDKFEPKILLLDKQHEEIRK